MKIVEAAVLGALALAACTPQKETQESAPPPQDIASQESAAAFTNEKLQTLRAQDGAAGSGCLADDAPLTDGAWLGYVKAWDAGGIDFDAACWYSGPPAAREAAARGAESPPPNDFYIVNDTKTVRRISIAGDVSAMRITHHANGGVTNEPTTYAGLVANSGTYMICPGEFCPVWVFVNSGQVTEVSMQYLP
jgi:hypothetical protein